MKPMPRWKKRSCAVLLALSALVLGCGHDRRPVEAGVELSPVYGDDGRLCGRGLAVVQTDYASTNIAIYDFEGELLSPSIVHSGSAGVTLNAPLGGDVVIAESIAAEELVLIDRYPSSVITLVDVASAQVTGQLAVRTGFDSNPRDFLAIGGGRALVSRYESNPRAGREPYDGGDDLLLVDMDRLSIEERISLNDESDSAVRPSSMLRWGDHVVVSLNRANAAFSAAKDAQLAVFDVATLREVERFTIPDLKVCDGLSLSPDGTRLAAACSGIVTALGDARPEGSGLVLFSKDETGRLKEQHRELAADLGLGPLGFSTTFADDGHVLLQSFGALEGADRGRPDRVLSFDMKQKKFEVLLEGEAFSLGAPACVRACRRCYVPDAKNRTLHIMDSDDRFISKQVNVETEVDLPPRQVAVF